MQPGIKVPPSLRNMYQELETDIPGFSRPEHGYLLDWAKQGILMLNATLTVTPHKANSHKDFGWQTFTDAVLDYLNREQENVVFALWGGFAKKKGKRIDRSRHAVVENAHPSPLSIKAWRGCRPFSKINAALLDAGKEPIDWALPAVVTLEHPSVCGGAAMRGEDSASVAVKKTAAKTSAAPKKKLAEEAETEVHDSVNVISYGAGKAMYTEADLQKNTVARLKELLRMRNQPVSGRKSDLVQRLLACNVSLKRARMDDGATASPTAPKQKRRKSEEEETAVAVPRGQTVPAAAAPIQSAPPSSGASSAVTPVLPNGETDFSQPPVAPGELKIVTWNVASWRAVQKKGLFDYVAAEQPDILCINETKVAEAQVPENVLPGYHQVFHSNTANPGYAGVAIFSKQKPLSVIRGLGDDGAFDDEQRALTFEFQEFFLVTTYVPNSGMKLARIGYRMGWDVRMAAFLEGLRARKPLVWCGDLNVARSELDLANPKTNKKTAGFTVEERTSFEEKFVQGLGLVDAFRCLHPAAKQFTFWPFRLNCRAKNIGWRLDYFMLSPELFAKVRHTWVRSNVLGSDHCPHGIVLAAS